jgi:hypothetical protein
LRSHALFPTLVIVFGLQASPALGQVASDSTRSTSAPETVLRRGDEVRLTLVDEKPRHAEGKVLDWDHDVIRLERFDEGVSVPFDRITRIERQTGSRGNFGPGAALGGIAGAVLFMGIVAATSKQELGYVPSGDIGTAFMFGAVTGIAVGGLLGATVFRTTVWQEVPAIRDGR